MNFKKVIATATAVATMTSMLGMTAFATETEPQWNVNGGKATVEGTSSVYEATIEVELPGNLAFGINPLKLTVDADDEGQNGKSDQIISGDFYVTNYSDIPVAVTATTFVSKLGENVDLKNDADWNTNTSELNPSEGKKAIWLVQLYATKVTTAADKDPVPSFTEITAGTTTKGDVVGDTLVKVADEKTPTEVTKKPIFVLAKWSETVTEQGKSMAAFKFGGAVDPNATFAEGDITVKTIFELKTLTQKQYTENYDTYVTVDGATVTSETIKKDKAAGSTPTP